MRFKSANGLTSAIAIAILAMACAAGPAASSAYSQKKPVRRTTAAPVTPPSIFGQGYQKGYTQGFLQGETDWRNGAARDFERSDAYQRRDQSYDPRLSTSQEYVQSYQLGFEIGYTDGYYGRARNAAVPANAQVLAKAAAIADAQRARERESGDARPRPDSGPSRPDSVPTRADSAPPPPDSMPSRDATRPRTTAPTVDVPPDTELRLRLTSPIDTRTAHVGDRFSAEVLMPSNYEGAKIEGHISSIKRSGRITGKTELALAFDEIVFPDGRGAPLHADLERIIESESVKKVDEEGNVETGSRSKDSQVRGGVGAAAGAIIGGIAGGAKGAVIGAILGGAAGVGTVYIEGNKDLILEPGTEMVVKTAGSRVR